MNIFVAGHRGMVGSALIRLLSSNRENNIITANRFSLDLLNQQSVTKFFDQYDIDEVYLAAAKVGGIHANNKYPAQFIYENMMIQANIIHAAHLADVHKLLFLGSSCIYPKLAEQPMREDCLLTGILEPTNEPYAIAKIAGIKMCESYNRQYHRDYRSVMPTNLYGQNDNFHPDNSHVIPAMMGRFHRAVKNNETEVIIWGSGTPKREFLHVDDMAAASIHVMGLASEIYSLHTDPMLSHINVGSGIDCTIKTLAEEIAKVTGFKGKLIFDSSKPDGSPRKLMDVSRLKRLGWQYSISLEEGLTKTYSWYKHNIKEARSI
jgi:GDP-L-fucose synthase